MPTQKITVPASSTPTIVEVSLPDTVVIKMSGGTPIPPPVVDPPPTIPPVPPVIGIPEGYKLNVNITFEPDNPTTAAVKALMTTHNQHGQGKIEIIDGNYVFHAIARWDSSRGWARSEIQTGSGEVNIYNPREGIWRVRVKFLSGTGTGSAEGVCLQHHGTVDGTSGDGGGWLAYTKAGVTYRNMRNTDGKSLPGNGSFTFAYDTWYTIEDIIFFTTGNTGYWTTNIYDAAGKLLKTMANAKNTRTSQNGEQFFKFGLYWWTSGNQGDALFDNVEIYQKQ